MDNTMERYLTVAEAARRLGRSIEQVRRYLREGRLVGRRIGQQWFIEEAALASWRAGRREPARVSEAMAVYEEKPMKETKKTQPLIDPELLREMRKTATRIREESGCILSKR